MRTYLFYDLETSGLNPCFDQVYQFAALRTDENLEILDEIEWTAQPTRDIIPTPIAMLTHQLPLEALMAGQAENEVVQQIHRLFNQPDTISLGYNTLSFDDDFLRFNFYRHLLTPYTHQFKDRCGRMDIYPMLVFYYLYAPETLNWPMLEGRLSLRLEHLSAYNQLAEGQAHHAMVDVRATLALAKILKREEKIWAYLLGFFDKVEEKKRVSNLKTETIGGQPFAFGLMIHAKWGQAVHYQAPVLCLGEHRHYRNQMCWLRLDQEDLLTAQAEDIIDKAWVVNKKWAEPPFVLPLQPRFIKDMEKLELAEEILRFFQAEPNLLKVIQDHYLEHKHPVYPDTDIDAALYQIGFMSAQDEFLSKKFHGAKADAKVAMKAAFASIELQQVAERYLGRFHYAHLSERERLKFDDYLAQIYFSENFNVYDYTHKETQRKLLRMTALAQIQAGDFSANLKREDLTLEQKKRLQELECYLLDLKINKNE